MDTCFEQGPIRPPSEAASLLIRVTRNCPYNKCFFCPVYKGSRFSARTTEEVLTEIDRVAKWHDAIKALPALTQEALDRLSQEAALVNEYEALAAAANFLLRGKGNSVFLQDADSLCLGSPPILAILARLRARFPQLRRVTTYARADTIARFSQAEIDALAAAGLNRIHIGMESGSDLVLQLVHKGITQAEIIRAGQMVKQAGIELSVYFMPGLGGQTYSDANADETAKALNAFNPDFIRIRTFTIPRPDNILAKLAQQGKFHPLGDAGKVAELARMLRQLTPELTSTIYSDHVLNLLEELHGKLPKDQARMLRTLDTFLALPEDEQRLFIVGRRGMVLRLLSDLQQKDRRAQAEALRQRYALFGPDFDQKIEGLMMQFI